MLRDRVAETGVGVTGKQGRGETWSQEQKPRGHLPPGHAVERNMQKPSKPHGTNGNRDTFRGCAQTLCVKALRQFCDLNQARQPARASVRAVSDTASRDHLRNVFTLSGRRDSSTGPRGICRDLAFASATSLSSDNR